LKLFNEIKKTCGKRENSAAEILISPKSFFSLSVVVYAVDQVPTSLKLISQSEIK
jgi:hypothetical protein